VKKKIRKEEKKYGGGGGGLVVGGGGGHSCHRHYHQKFMAPTLGGSNQALCALCNLKVLTT